MTNQIKLGHFSNETKKISIYRMVYSSVGGYGQEPILSRYATRSNNDKANITNQTKLGHFSNETIQFSNYRTVYSNVGG